MKSRFWYRVASVAGVGSVAVLFAADDGWMGLAVMGAWAALMVVQAIALKKAAKEVEKIYGNQGSQPSSRHT